MTAAPMRASRNIRHRQSHDAKHVVSKEIHVEVNQKHATVRRHESMTGQQPHIGSTIQRTPGTCCKRSTHCCRRPKGGVPAVRPGGTRAVGVEPKILSLKGDRDFFSTVSTAIWRSRLRSWARVACCCSSPAPPGIQEVRSRVWERFCHQSHYGALLPEQRKFGF